MDFFMISWKYACFPYYFWEDKNLRLSVSVENHSYIHFLASNKMIFWNLLFLKKKFWVKLLNNGEHKYAFYAQLALIVQ